MPRQRTAHRPALRFFLNPGHPVAFGHAREAPQSDRSVKAATGYQFPIRGHSYAILLSRVPLQASENSSA